MKKRNLFFVLIALSLLLLFGCSSMKAGKKAIASESATIQGEAYTFTLYADRAELTGRIEEKESVLKALLIKHAMEGKLSLQLTEDRAVFLENEPVSKEEMLAFAESLFADLEHKAASPAMLSIKGYGTATRGGLDGKVVKVTNLNAEGPGSFKAALEEEGKRVIVFEVGGIIDLGKVQLELKNPYVTIAGQTAPSPGITLIRGGLTVDTHDVVIQHIRLRMGDAGAEKGSGYEPEVSTTENAYNVVFDHTSVSWGVDENLSVSGYRYIPAGENVHDVTLTDNIIAEGLGFSVHSKDSNHSMGTLVHDNATNVTIIRNFYVHNFERNPWFKGNTNGVILNNLIYDPGKWAIRLEWLPKEWKGKQEPEDCKVSVVGNYMKPGPGTVDNLPLVTSNFKTGKGYLEDNIIEKGPLYGGGVTIVDSKMDWVDGLDTLPAAEVPAYITAYAGARPNDRDAVDQRLFEEFQNGGGKMINSQNEVGGYPTEEPSSRTLTVPETGLEEWLEAYTLSVIL